LGVAGLEFAVRRGTLRCPTLYGSSPFRIARAGRRAEV